MVIYPVSRRLIAKPAWSALNKLFPYRSERALSRILHDSPDTGLTHNDWNSRQEPGIGTVWFSWIMNEARQIGNEGKPLILAEIEHYWVDLFKILLSQPYSTSNGRPALLPPSSFIQSNLFGHVTFYPGAFLEVYGQDLNEISVAVESIVLPLAQEFRIDDGGLFRQRSDATAISHAILKNAGLVGE